MDFLSRCIDLASDLGASVVSLWAGKAPGGVVGDEKNGSDAKNVELLFERLCAGLRTILQRGRDQGVQIAFEPEPGMFIERPSGFERVCQELGTEGEELGLCLDVGHLLCTGDLPVETVISRYADQLRMVHLDDIKDGVHIHRMFGEGDLDLAKTMGALVQVGYSGIAAVELSRDAHRGPEAAAQAMSHLRKALTGAAAL